MEFDRPDAVSAMNDAVAAVGDEGDAWDVVGEPMTQPVDEVLAAYEEKLRLRLNPSPRAKRLEVGGLAWGRIGKDVARLNGLAAAIENISATVKSGKQRLAADWTGEEYDAFRAAVEKIEGTLDAYSSAVRAAASDLAAALDGIRTLYDTYRDQSLAWHLTFDGLAPPADWWRMWRNDAEFLADNCSSAHGGAKTCGYRDGEQVEIISDQLVNRRLFDRLAKWSCTDDPAVVISQYRGTVDDARHERTLISGKIHNWYVATDQLKRNVDEMLAAGLENLRKIAESDVFASMTVPGGENLDDPVELDAALPPEPQPEAESEPQPEPAADSEAEPEAEPEVEPEAEPKAESEVESEPVESAEVPTPPAEAPTVSGDGWSIWVTSLDAAGHLGIRVEVGDEPAKRYGLDLDAASGLSPLADEGADPDVTLVPAGTNGQCVVKDGSLTITAERPLFDPDTIKLDIDDETGRRTTHTVDLAEIGAPAEPAEPEHVSGALDLDRPESLSGVLVPDQATGEAGPADAANVEMWVGMGWSVHGDLFDNGDPVYSVHGVLVEDDGEGR